MAGSFLQLHKTSFRYFPHIFGLLPNIGLTAIVNAWCSVTAAEGERDCVILQQRLYTETWHGVRNPPAFIFPSSRLHPLCSDACRLFVLLSIIISPCTSCCNYSSSLCQCERTRTLTQGLTSVPVKVVIFPAALEHLSPVACLCKEATGRLVY